MDSKAYELLEKLYEEMQDVKSDLSEIKSTMATKVELEEVKSTMATKEDLNILSEELHTEIQAVYDEVKELRQDLNYIEIVTTKNAYELAILKAAR